MTRVVLGFHDNYCEFLRQLQVIELFIILQTCIFNNCNSLCKTCVCHSRRAIQTKHAKSPTMICHLLLISVDSLIMSMPN